MRWRSAFLVATLLLSGCESLGHCAFSPEHGWIAVTGPPAEVFEGADSREATAPIAWYVSGNGDAMACGNLNHPKNCQASRMTFVRGTAGYGKPRVSMCNSHYRLETMAPPDNRLDLPRHE